MIGWYLFCAAVVVIVCQWRDITAYRKAINHLNLICGDLREDVRFSERHAKALEAELDEWHEWGVMTPKDQRLA